MIKVESYYESGSGLHGDVHVRPLPGQSPYETWMRVECKKLLMDPKVFKVGTKFLIRRRLQIVKVEIRLFIHTTLGNLQLSSRNYRLLTLVIN
jgi:hypothetical protein